MHRHTCPRCYEKFFSASTAASLRCPYCGYIKQRKYTSTERTTLLCFIALALMFIVAAIQVGRYVEKQAQRRDAQSAHSFSNGEKQGWDRGTARERF